MNCVDVAVGGVFRRTSPRVGVNPEMIVQYYYFERQ